MSKSSKYWERRALERLTKSEMYGKDGYLHIANAYTSAYRDINKMIDNVYKNYSKEVGLDKQQLQTLLSKKESDEYWNTLEGKGYKQYVKNNYKSRISRLEQLKGELYVKAKEVGIQETKASSDIYKAVIHNNYNQTIEDTSTQLGRSLKIGSIDSKTIDEVLSTKWNPKHYSDRIWTNSDIIGEKFGEVFAKGVMSGSSKERICRYIREIMKVGKYATARLVRTELNHFHNSAEILAYKEMGIEEYVFMAYLDGKTSSVCKHMDGKKIKVSEAKEGDNLPPLHPNCRSTIRPYVGKEYEPKQRAVRDITTNEVKTIQYAEYDAFKLQSDYDNYVSVLGSKRVGTFENYKNIVYNKSINQLEVLKREYKTINLINHKSDYIDRDIDTYYNFRNNNFEVTNHFIERYFERMYKKNGDINYVFDDVLRVLNSEFNYVDSTNGRLIKYYNNIGICFDENTLEVVTLMKQREVNKKWKNL
ncbi:MAG: minor capsid protein [Erysipelotrichaceae bacterium]